MISFTERARVGDRCEVRLRVARQRADARGRLVAGEVTIFRAGDVVSVSAERVVVRVDRVDIPRHVLMADVVAVWKRAHKASVGVRACAVEG